MNSPGYCGLGKSSQEWRALPVCDEVVARVGDDPEPAVREKVAMALEVKPEAATSAGAGEAAGDITFPTTMPT